VSFASALSIVCRLLVYSHILEYQTYTFQRYISQARAIDKFSRTTLQFTTIHYYSIKLYSILSFASVFYRLLVYSIVC